MDERRKIDCVSAADRDTLVMILARNGYAVRQAKRNLQKLHLLRRILEGRRKAAVRKGTKRITVVVTAQSYYHLRHLADMAGYNSIGRVIDKLVREHQLAMRGGYTTEKPNEGERPCRERTDRHPTRKTR